MRHIFTSLALITAAACSQQTGPEPTPVETSAVDAETIKRQAENDGALLALLDAMWEERVELSPEYQTRLGRKTNYDRWNDRSAEAANRERKLLEDQLAIVRSRFNRDDLSQEGQLNHDLFIYQTENQLALDNFRLHRFPLSQFRGVHSSVPVFLANYHRIDTLSDAEAYIARVAAVDKVLAQAADALEERLEPGFVLPAFSYPLIEEAARNAKSGASVRADFAKKIAALDLPATEQQRLLTALDEALTGPYATGYEAFADRVRVMSGSDAIQGNYGVGRFTDGEAYYNALLRNYTTTDLTADEVHELGLQEVARIHEEMRAIMKTVGFEGDLQGFFAFMRTDDRFYLPNTDEGRAEYLALARSYIEKMETKLGELFNIKPRAVVEVRRVEPFRERAAGKAFYSQPDEEGTRPGYFYANLAEMQDMPTYQLEALVYHEAIPGHHMQRALQIEQKGLPLFRRFGGATAYTEGWGLYSELLPKEVGFYEDPYSDFGRLAMELWRAARLVVDTGLHAKGWEMQEAIDYLQANTPNPEGDTVKAIERYIVFPGQATAYKIGMLKLIELRSKAEAELGDEFDIRGFHDTILKAGPLPLAVLEGQIDRWIDEQKG